MKRIIKELMKPRVAKRFQCSCGCVWDSDEYTKHKAGGRIVRIDYCPKCDRIGANIKSSG